MGTLNEISEPFRSSETNKPHQPEEQKKEAQPEGVADLFEGQSNQGDIYSNVEVTSEESTRAVEEKRLRVDAIGDELLRVFLTYVGLFSYSAVAEVKDKAVDVHGNEGLRALLEMLNTMLGVCGKIDISGCGGGPMRETVKQMLLFCEGFLNGLTAHKDIHTQSSFIYWRLLPAYLGEPRDEKHYLALLVGHLNRVEFYISAEVKEAEKEMILERVPYDIKHL